MNHVLMVTYNNVELTQAAVQSALAQDIGPIHLHVVNNGSTDGTRSWLDNIATFDRFGVRRKKIIEDGNEISAEHYPSNQSPVKVMNKVLAHYFDRGYDRILGIPNDVVLPHNLYRLMDRWPRGFVTASQTDQRDFPLFEKASAVNECTPMAVGIIRKWAYDALVAKDGYFLDENFVHYASDCDLALRMAACGIRGVQLDVQYWHYCSASWRLAPPEEGRMANLQADDDRAYFEQKWGFRVDDAKYGESAGDINFRGERVDV